MADINVNNNYRDMKNLTPFKLCVLQNFPFIEADFDAVTNYQLLCKVVEYLNKVIDNNNKQNDNINQLEQNFITLYNYVKDYFDNLDVQKEINMKLDEMSEDGTLAKIINQDIFSELNKKINILSPKNKKIIFVGDSFIANYEKNWAYYVKANLSVDGYIWGVGGSGFSVPDYQWIDIMKRRETLVADKESITDIIFASGGNDNSHVSTLYNDMADIKRYINTTYPNAQISVAFLGWTGIQKNRLIYKDGRNAYISNSIKLGFRYLTGCEWVLHNYKYLKDNTAVNENDYLHPTDEGCEALGNAVTLAFLNGFVNIYYEENIFLTKGDSLNDLTFCNYIKFILNNDKLIIEKEGFSNFVFKTAITNGEPINIASFKSPDLFREKSQLVLNGLVINNPSGITHNPMLLLDINAISDNTITGTYYGHETESSFSCINGTYCVIISTMDN